VKDLESHVNATTTQVDACFQRDAAIKRRIAEKYSGALDHLAGVYRGFGGHYTDTGALDRRAGEMSLELERTLSAAPVPEK
jgi:hypothetical protein